MCSMSNDAIHRKHMFVCFLILSLGAPVPCKRTLEAALTGNLSSSSFHLVYNKTFFPFSQWTLTV